MWAQGDLISCLYGFFQKLNSQINENSFVRPQMLTWFGKVTRAALRKYDIDEPGEERREGGCVRGLDWRNKIKSKFQF